MFVFPKIKIAKQQSKVVRLNMFVFDIVNLNVYPFKESGKEKCKLKLHRKRE